MVIEKDELDNFVNPGGLVKERWLVLEKIGRGGFGSVYEVFDLARRRICAMKIESSKGRTQVLKMEVQVLRAMQGKPHICSFVGCGRNEVYNYVVMSLTSRSLSELRRESKEQRFTLGTVLKLASQCLESIKDLHDGGYLHRDIKPSNYSLGRHQSNKRTVYMLDFGLARQYLLKSGKLRTPRSAAGFRGTVRYASLNAHKNKELGRHDDLWCLFYMTVELMKGKLPWRKLTDKLAVQRAKEQTSLDVLLAGCPLELLQIERHLQSLKYETTPDYELIERVIFIITTKHSVNQEEPFDWESHDPLLAESAMTPVDLNDPGQIDHAREANLLPGEKAQSTRFLNKMGPTIQDDTLLPNSPTNAERATK